MIDLFDTYEVYPEDAPLLKKMGLKHDFKADTHSKVYLGEHKPDDGGSVKVTVTGAPAQFWTFEIESCEGQKFKMTTGSGTFSEYWPVAERVLQGMICMEKI